VPWQKRDDAAVKGTDIHALAEKLTHGESVDVPEHIADHVEACATFLDEWGVTPIITERPLAHRAHWWAGTPDLFARLKDGRTALLDWKTGSGIYPEAAFQLAAYRYAEFYLHEDGTEQPIPEVDLVAAVHIRAGDYDVVPLKADEDTYREFRHIAYVADAAKRAKGNTRELGYVGVPLPAPTNVTEIAS
jgi:hypothetical protein